MKIVVISDTHNKHEKLVIPECDLLISCGDYSFWGFEWEVKNFHEWLNKQPAKHLVSIQGNHEKFVDNNYLNCLEIAQKACPRVAFTYEGPVDIEGHLIWCSSLTPHFNTWPWDGFKNYTRYNKFEHDAIEIMVTHSPPYGILDEVSNFGIKQNMGCKYLLGEIKHLTNLKHHFFGHIHSSYGQMEVNGVNFYNAAICNRKYKVVNKPVVVQI